MKIAQGNYFPAGYALVSPANPNSTVEYNATFLKKTVKPNQSPNMAT